MQEMKRGTDKRKFDACRMEIVSFGNKDLIATSGFESEDHFFGDGAFNPDGTMKEHAE